MSDEIVYSPGEPPAPKTPGKTAWRLPAIAGLMLVIGLVTGYLSRPTIENRFFSEPTATTDPTDPRARLRDEVQAQTRHYLGDPDAPVTLIEFGDFQ